MIDSFEVERFRAFRHLSLRGLKPVNIIVGKSASGKTALLEAIRVGLGATPTVAWLINSQRGVPLAMQFNPTREQFEAAWKSYFHDFDISEKISFRTKDSEGHQALLEMFFDTLRPVTPLPMQPTIPGIQAFTNTIVPLSFYRMSFSGEESVLDATIHQQQHGQLHLQQGPELGTVSEFFPSTWQSNAPQVANWYSQLRVSHKADDLLDIISAQFPEINSLSSESPFGVPSIYASVKHRSEMMPISLVSSGLNKFLSLLIAIRTYRGGVVLIDEIENGIYFKMFPSMWETLHRFAKANQTQIFVSSHSLECLRGAVDTINSNADDFSLIQISTENGASKAHMAAGEDAAAAIQSDIELRV
jgi:predicted ATPase